LPFGVLKQAARLWSSYGRETQIYGFFLLYWVDKSFSLYILLNKGLKQNKKLLAFFITNRVIKKAILV
jgi:hypothetical protein